jgi:small subunit ribosomal protein S15
LVVELLQLIIIIRQVSKKMYTFHQYTPLWKRIISVNSIHLPFKTTKNVTLLTRSNFLSSTSATSSVNQQQQQHQSPLLTNNTQQQPITNMEQAKELARKILFGDEFVSVASTRTKKRKEMLQTAQKHSTDTGSSQAQIAALTARISALTEHLRTHRKDKHSLRGLQGMLSLRKKQVKYLSRTDPEECDRITSMFKIKRHIPTSPIEIFTTRQLQRIERHQMQQRAGGGKVISTKAAAAKKATVAAAAKKAAAAAATAATTTNSTKPPTSSLSGNKKPTTSVTTGVSSSSSSSTKSATTTSSSGTGKKKQ